MYCPYTVVRCSRPQTVGGNIEFSSGRKGHIKGLTAVWSPTLGTAPLLSRCGSTRRGGVHLRGPVPASLLTRLSPVVVST
eukprot:1006490-Prorocentrum_minimum.AAC.1